MDDRNLPQRKHLAHPYYLLPLTYYLFVPALVGFRHNDRLLLRFRIDRVDLIL
jgi:hypothetical protein